MLCKLHTHKNKNEIKIYTNNKKIFVLAPQSIFVLESDSMQLDTIHEHDSLGE